MSVTRMTKKTSVSINGFESCIASLEPQRGSASRVLQHDMGHHIARIAATVGYLFQQLEEVFQEYQPHSFGLAGVEASHQFQDQLISFSFHQLQSVILRFDLLQFDPF